MEVIKKPQLMIATLWGEWDLNPQGVTTGGF
jgi:hypothetical protein